MDKQIQVAVIGCGARGVGYAKKMIALGKKYAVTAACDKNPDRLKIMQGEAGVPENALFLSEDEFFSRKRADLLIVATQDRDHVGHALKGLALGYDVLTEKPVSPSEAECRALLKAQKESGKHVFVCHELRYAPAFHKCKELLDSGVIGKLVTIMHIEQVHYAHQAHSFVRGNWRREDETSPMILAKCCHDMDLLHWYTGSPAKTVSSAGDLRFFTPENRPEGAADRCVECSYIDTCPYSAVRLYEKEGFWGRTHITNAYPLTDEAVAEAVQSGPYGRCVFACDNDVVDNQQTLITFENGVTATLLMTAFTQTGGRIVRFYGTYGEIDLDEHEGYIDVKPFGKEKQRILLSELIEGALGHGGGDDALIAGIYDVLTGKQEALTPLSASLESHLMAFAAERARLSGKTEPVIHD